MTFSRSLKYIVQATKKQPQLLFVRRLNNLA